MNIADFLHQQGDKRGFSFEVLPPLKGNGTAALFRTIDNLKEFDPRFINITTHHSEYVYKELENGLLTRQRVRRRRSPHGKDTRCYRNKHREYCL